MLPEQIPCTWSLNKFHCSLMERFDLESKCSATPVLSEATFLFYFHIEIKEIRWRLLKMLPVYVKMLPLNVKI